MSKLIDEITGWLCECSNRSMLDSVKFNHVFVYFGDYRLSFSSRPPKTRNDPWAFKFEVSEGNQAREYNNAIASEMIHTVLDFIKLREIEKQDGNLLLAKEVCTLFEQWARIPYSNPESVDYKEAYEAFSEKLDEWKESNRKRKP